MKNTKLLLLLTILSVPAAFGSPAHSQTREAATPISSGMIIKDTAGGVVGTVKSVEGDYLIIKTDKHEAKLPKSSFTVANGGLLAGITQAQLNESIEAEFAKAKAQIVAGASVIGSAGQPVGTIDAVYGEQFTLKLTTGEMVQLPMNSVVPGEKGLVLGITADQLRAAVEAAQKGS